MRKHALTRHAQRARAKVAQKAKEPGSLVKIPAADAALGGAAAEPAAVLGALGGKVRPRARNLPRSHACSDLPRRALSRGTSRQCVPPPPAPSATAALPGSVSFGPALERRW
jgi:hypothetical protein